MPETYEYAAKKVRCGDVGWALARDMGHEILSGVVLCTCAAGVREVGLMNKQISGFSLNQLPHILTVTISGCQ